MNPTILTFFAHPDDETILAGGTLALLALLATLAMHGAPVHYLCATRGGGGETWNEHPRPRLANRDQPAHFTIDVQPAPERKAKAALCHKTIVGVMPTV